MPRPLSAAKVALFREHLLDAATCRFAAHGVHGLTLRALAADLGVSPMTPYRYFADKDAILAAMQARAFDRFATALESAFASARSATQRARAVGAAYLRFAFDHKESYRLMFDLPIADAKAHPDLERAAARARVTMTAYVGDLVEAGRMKGDPARIGHAVWALMHGAVMLELAGKFTSDCDFETVIETGVNALLKSFAATPAPRRRASS